MHCIHEQILLPHPFFVEVTKTATCDMDLCNLLLIQQVMAPTHSCPCPLLFYPRPLLSNTPPTLVLDASIGRETGLQC